MIYARHIIVPTVRSTSSTHHCRSMCAVKSIKINTKPTGRGQAKHINNGVYHQTQHQKHYSNHPIQRQQCNMRKIARWKMYKCLGYVVRVNAVPPARLYLCHLLTLPLSFASPFILPRCVCVCLSLARTLPSRTATVPSRCACVCVCVFVNGIESRSHIVTHRLPQLVQFPRKHMDETFFDFEAFGSMGSTRQPTSQIVGLYFSIIPINISQLRS